MGFNVNGGREECMPGPDGVGGDHSQYACASQANPIGRHRWVRS